MCYIFWWAYPAALQWCANAKGFLYLGEKMLVHTQTEVQLIFMENFKSPTHLIIYLVVSMQIQKLSHRYLHLKFMARVYQSQITCQFSWNLCHRKEFFMTTVDFNLKAEENNRWSVQRGHTSNAVDSSCCLGPSSSKRPNSETYVDEDYLAGWGRMTFWWWNLIKCLKNWKWFNLFFTAFCACIVSFALCF